MNKQRLGHLLFVVALLSLLCCAHRTLSPLAVSAQLGFDGLKSTTIDAWWPEDEQHNDAKILLQRIDLNDLEIDPKASYNLSAFMHYGHVHSIRRETWSSITAAKKYKKRDLDTIYISLVPSFSIGANRFVLLPSRVGFETKYNSFSFKAVEFSNYETQAIDFPHYYPTASLAVNDKKVLSYLLNQMTMLQGPEQCEILGPVQVTGSQLRHFSNVGDLLAKVLENQGPLSFPKHIDHHKLDGTKLKMKPLGFGKTVKIGDKNYKSASLTYGVNAYTYFFTDQIKQGKSDSLLGERPKIDLNIQLPPKIAKVIVKNNEFARLSVAGRKDVRPFGEGRPEEFQINGMELQGNYAIQISGFKVLSKTPYHEDDRTQYIKIDPKELIALVSIKLDKTYWFDERKLNAGQVEIEIPYTDISGKQLRFRVNPKGDSPEDGILEVSVEQVLEKQIHSLFTMRRFALISWPTLWGRPPNIPEKCFVKTAQDSARSSLLGSPGQGDIGPVSWGPGWVPVRLSLSPRKTVELSEYLRPTWPFKKGDPWLSSDLPRKLHKDQCLDEPVYRVRTIQYINSSMGKDNLLKDKTQNKKDELPTLREVDWPEDWPLPNKVCLQIEQIDTNPVKKYKRTEEISWQIAEVKRETRFTLKEKFSKQLLNNLSLKAPDQPEIPYSSDIEFYLYESLEACNQELTNTSPALYLPEELEREQVNVCSAAKLIQNAVPLTNCVEARLDGTKVIFDFIPVKCIGQRKLLIISLSQGLERLHPNTLNDFLVKIFVEMKMGKRKRVPFTLLFIEQGRRLSRSLDCEELGTLAEFGTRDSISKRLVLRPYTGSDMRALEDLNMVDTEFNADELESVLYVTDNSRMNYDGDIPAVALATPLKWARNNVKLRVLTSERCDTWTSDAAAECVHCSDLKKIQDEIESFISD